MHDDAQGTEPTGMPDWYEPPTKEDWEKWFAYLEDAGLESSCVIPTD